MIKPHGSEELMPRIVNTDEEKKSLLKSASEMKKMKVTSAAAANLVMLGAGYFTPLDGFMNKDEEIILGKPRFPENFNKNEYMVELVNTHPQNPFLYTKIIYE